MKAHIQLKLYATLGRFTPPSGEPYPIEKGDTVRQLIENLKIPEKEVKLVFINGIKGGLASILNGGERVGLFPPIGGG